MSHPIVKLGAVGNIYSRQMHFQKAGDIEMGHTHQFDHLTLLATGKLQVTVEGVITNFDAPHMIYIHKNKNHELVSLEDNTVAYCIHPIKDSDGNIISVDMIPTGVIPND